jgi:hypothetical protein
MDLSLSALRAPSDSFATRSTSMTPNRLHPATCMRVALLAALALSGNLARGGDAGVPAGGSEAPPLWLISTRAAPQCGDLKDGARSICRWQWKADDCWTAKEANAFSAVADSSVPVVVLVHGNGTTADEAVEHGWQMYQTLRQDARDRSFRCVIWSWPSDRQSRRLRPDVQLKQAYSNAESYYLAEWLAALPRKTPVCLIGHSLGARIITGALQLMAGGQLAGRSLAARPTETDGPARRPLRVMLLAAAIDSDWLVPGHRDGLALAWVEQMLITRNACDRALRWYPRIAGRRGPEAMGFVGPLLHDGGKTVEAVDVSGSVGKSHDVRCYLASPEFRCRLARYAFLEGVSPGESPRKP